uniref:Putative phage/plasmid primase n=1 Tax=Prasiolopsis wulf-kochii TaxID=3239232 RepID=A0A097KK40_9CHLO|nr:putative phage/plasmid primase [Prasiolopsis sp. SAG 84.81]
MEDNNELDCKKTYDTIQAMLALGINVEAKSDKKHRGRATPITTVESAREFQNKQPGGTLFYLSLKPNDRYPEGLVSIDVDNRVVWNILCNMHENHHFSKSIFNPKNRGEHIIYAARKVSKNRIKNTINLGFAADYITNQINIIAPGKYVASFPRKGESLAELPYIFELTSRKFKTEPLISNSKIQEVERNQKLFQWCNGLEGNKEDKIILARILGKYFCNPPLPNDECRALVKDDEFVNKNIVSSNSRVSNETIQDIKFIISFCDNKYCYVESENKMAWFCGTHWEYLSVGAFEVILEKFILDNHHKINTKLTHMNTIQMAKNYSWRVKGLLGIRPEWKIFPNGINFKNGYLEYETGRLLPHTHKRWITYVSSEEYDRNAKLSLRTRETLMNMFGRDAHNINLYRSAGYRALTHCPAFQTGYFFYGSPGMGKSTLINLLLFLTKSNSGSCELKDLGNPFNRFEVMHYNLLVINEIHNVDKKTERYLKEFLGRDQIAAEVKNVQGYTAKTFQGLIIMASNQVPTKVFENNTAMLDRTVPILFSPRLERADPFLLDSFKKEFRTWINWHLSIYKEGLETLTRAAWMHKESLFYNSIMAEFIIMNLTFREDAFLIITDFKDKYNDFLIERRFNVGDLEDTFIELVEVGTSIFKKYL